MLSPELLINNNGLNQTDYPDLGLSFVWRLLNQREYAVFRGMRDQLHIHEFNIYRMVFEYSYTGDRHLLSPKIPLGCLVSIGELNMWISGDCRAQTILDDIAEARNTIPMDNILQHMKSVIYTAFTQYLPEDLEKLTYRDLLIRFAEAENVLSYRNSQFQKLDLKAIKRESAKKKDEFTVIDSATAQAEAEMLATQWDKLDANLDKLSARKLDNIKRTRK